MTSESYSQLATPKILIRVLRCKLSRYHKVRTKSVAYQTILES